LKARIPASSAVSRISQPSATSLSRAYRHFCRQLGIGRLRQMIPYFVRFCQGKRFFSHGHVRQQRFASSMLLISTNRVRYCNINPSEPGSNTPSAVPAEPIFAAESMPDLEQGIQSFWIRIMPVVVLDQSNLCCNAAKLIENLHPASCHSANITCNPLLRGESSALKMVSVQASFQRLGNGKSRRPNR